MIFPVKTLFFLNEAERKAISLFVNRLCEVEGKKTISQLLLFGSKARGDDKKGSDIDLIAVLTNRGKDENVYRGVAHVLSSFGVYLSVKTFSQREFRRLAGMKTPFMGSVARESIILWPKPSKHFYL